MSPPAEPLKPDPFSVRFLGILTAIALVALAVAFYVLPSRPALIVGGLGHLRMY